MEIEVGQQEHGFSTEQYILMQMAAMSIYNAAMLNANAEVPRLRHDEKIKDGLDELCRIVGVKALAK